MHKYQVTSATVLPIATEDIAGKTEAAKAASDGTGQDWASSDKALKPAVVERLVVTSFKSNSNLGVAFTPHAQSLLPIAGSQGQEPTTTATTATTADQQATANAIMHAALGGQIVDGSSSAPVPAPEATTESKTTSQQQQESPKKSAIPLRRATVEIGGDKARPMRVQRKRSMSLQPTKAIELTKNYEQLVREFNTLRPFTRIPDGSYPRDTKCVICRRARPSSVFFPCQHRCVCDDCIVSHRISADRTNPSNWCACPVCMADICLILAHSGKEEEKYWKWVMEVQPRLSTQFKHEFKETARRLEKGTTTASVTYESEDVTKLQSSDKLAPRRHTWQQPYQRTNRSMRSFRANRDTSRDINHSTCSIL